MGEIKLAIPTLGDGIFGDGTLRERRCGGQSLGEFAVKNSFKD
jgi:hypothetical protein